LSLSGVFSSGALDGAGQPIALPGHMPALLVVPRYPFVSGAFSCGALDGVDQSIPLPGDIPALFVVRNQRLDELHRVIPDDLADRRSVRPRPFQPIGTLPD